MVSSETKADLRGITCRGLIEAQLILLKISHYLLHLRGITCRGLIEAQLARGGALLEAPISAALLAAASLKRGKATLVALSFLISAALLAAASLKHLVLGRALRRHVAISAALLAAASLKLHINGKHAVAP